MENFGKFLFHVHRLENRLGEIAISRSSKIESPWQYKNQADSHLQLRSHSRSQSASHKTGLRIRALDVNQSRSHVVLAGGKILKTVRIDQSTCTEDFNLRAAALNHAWRGASDASNQRRRGSYEVEDVSGIQRETFDIEDVAWSNGPFSRHIATAASNGKIMLYDLGRPGVEVGRLHEHYRQVHKVDFNPLEGGFLLSGSQDGTVRLWDMREFRSNVTTFYSKDTFPGRSDGVRHTKWSPNQTWNFALATDNGTVQFWDTRHNKSPLLKIAAHSGTCNSIDWHPDGKHLVSAGRDQNVKVWSLAGDRKQKPSYQLRAPKEVQNVRWRPPCFVTDGAELKVKQCTHLATSYRRYPAVHVWDLRRPFIPFREIYHEVNSGTTDMLWHSKDLLWTVGAEGEFNQSDIRYAVTTLDRRPLTTMDWSVRGEMTFFAQERPPRGRAGAQSDSADQSTPRPDPAPSLSPANYSLGRVHGDDSLEEKFLSTSVPSRRHSRASSLKSKGPFGSTPPSYEDYKKPVDHLDQTMRRYEAGPTEQVSKYGKFFDDGFSTGANPLVDDVDRPGVLLSPSGGIIWSPNQCIERLTDKASKLEDRDDVDAWDLIGSKISHAFNEMKRQGILSQPELTRVISSSDKEKDADNAENPNSCKEVSDYLLRPKPVVPRSTATTPLARPVPDRNPENCLPETPPLDLAMGNLSHDEGDLSRRSTEGTSAVGLSALDQISPLVERTGESSHSNIQRIDSQPDTPFLQDSQPESFEQNKDKLRRQQRGSVNSSGIFPASLDSPAGLEKFESFASVETETSSNIEPQKNDATVSQSVPTSFALPKPHAKDPAAQSLPENDNISISVLKANDIPTINPPTSDDSPNLDIINPNSFDSGYESQSPIHASLKSSTSKTALALESLKDLLEYYTDTSDARGASELYLICAPLINLLTRSSPTSLPTNDLKTSLSSSHTEASTSQNFSTSHQSYRDYLTSHLSLPTSIAESIIATSHKPLEAANLPPLMIESILSTYHKRLVTLKLFKEASILRKLSYPAFPAVYELGLRDVNVMNVCRSCHNAIDGNVASKSDGISCDKCGVHVQGCVFCRCARSPYLLMQNAERENNGKKARSSSSNGEKQNVTTSTLYLACPLCNHSLHLPCAQKWFSIPESGGACPTEGCVCVCAPGRLRVELLEVVKLASAGMMTGGGLALARERSSRGGGAGDGGAGDGTVKGDERDIGESWAVRRAVGALREG